MRIISMNSVYKKLEDPFEAFRREYPESDLDTAAILANSQDKSDFQNVDQMIYLHHYGKYLPKKVDARDQLKEDLMVEESPLILDEGGDLEDAPKNKKKRWPFGKKKAKTEEEDPESEE